MNWGLTQGILGQKRTGLAPSSAALGPNIYLTQRDFFKMLLAAFAVHAIIFTIAALMPDETVTNIPVRAISFKLGDGTAATASAPTLPPPLPVPAITSMVNEIPRSPSTLETRAIAPSPQQFVREVGAAPPAAAAPGKGEESATVEAIREYYKQQISGWIEKHKYYPAAANGSEGRVILRIRIDRHGNVRYYAVEQSSGISELDKAALDMVQRANPMPAVPGNYPAGALVEFLIPISFKVPQ